ncbi:LPS export ABC transporter permease LptF [Sulfuriferula nivalis]|uniref:Lipopolysaccharide export system permease protein LptF n=1 Tax=Sulfuriferula nivalis TaxID=2675298 RepID=A0A809RR23_9PROT|nr:LPS export ABC transporter permease LptF [Sulfuriferula nivalis]BBP01311.1 LPS export ABC transporter permease LptF [Sulfuriferula nivalis]
MKLFHRALLRELIFNYLAVFLVLLVITLTTLFIRLLGDAARGEMVVEAVLTFLGFGVFSFLPMLLSLALFISIIMALSRAYRESEMVVWFSAGLGLNAWLRPILTFALPVVLAIGTLNLAVIPWALSKKDTFRQILDSRDELSLITPGLFVESKQADKVYFVEGLADNGARVKNLFMQSTQDGVLGITVAQSGVHKRLPNGERYLVLENGRRYEGTPGLADYKIAEFGHYWMWLEPKTISLHRDLGANSLPATTLLQQSTPANLAEFVWRFGFPVSALVLAILAIPLSFVNPRAGRSFSLILSLLIFVIYNNLLGIIQAWVAQEKISFVAGLLGVHLFMLGLASIMFYQRMSLRRGLFK